VWGPLVRFKHLAPAEFAVQGKALAAAIAGSRPAYNPLIAGLFKEFAPASLADVEARYNMLFAGLEAQAHAYIAPKARSTTAVVPGFDPALAELLEAPFEIALPSALTTNGLREYTRSWPQRYRGQTPFLYNALDELDLTHPGAPARAMVVEDVEQPKDSP